MTKTITFNELRRLKDRLPDGSMHQIADRLNTTVQTVRNYFGGSNYDFGKNCGVHIEPGPDGGIVVLTSCKAINIAAKVSVCVVNLGLRQDNFVIKNISLKFLGGDKHQQLVNYW